MKSNGKRLVCFSFYSSIRCPTVLGMADHWQTHHLSVSSDERTRCIARRIDFHRMIRREWRFTCDSLNMRQTQFKLPLIDAPGWSVRSRFCKIIQNHPKPFRLRCPPYLSRSLSHSLSLLGPQERTLTKEDLALSRS